MRYYIYAWCEGVRTGYISYLANKACSEMRLFLFYVLYVLHFTRRFQRQSSLVGIWWMFVSAGPEKRLVPADRKKGGGGEGESTRVTLLEQKNSYGKLEEAL